MVPEITRGVLHILHTVRADPKYYFSIINIVRAVNKGRTFDRHYEG